MHNNTITFFISCFLFLSINSFGQDRTIELPTFSFEIPEGMKSNPLDTSISEIANLSLDDELFILVADNFEELMAHSRKGALGESKMAINLSFGVKFLKLKNIYKGFDESNKKEGKFKSNNYVSQTFKAKIYNGDEVIFLYRVMKINDRFYDFTITGKTKKAKAHQKLIKAFWESIKEN